MTPAAASAFLAMASAETLHDAEDWGCVAAARGATEQEVASALQTWADSRADEVQTVESQPEPAAACKEMWRRVPGSPDYEVSNTGRVVSYKAKRPYELRPIPHVRGYLMVHLRHEGKRRCAPIHQLVAEAFHGPRPEGMEHIRHLDGDKHNNRADNLAYGTRSENMRDAIRHGVHNHASKTHCIHGHPLEGPPNSGGPRPCVTCHRASKATSRCLCSHPRSSHSMRTGDCWSAACGCSRFRAPAPRPAGDGGPSLTEFLESKGER